MRTIRTGVFETNSSSTHSVTIFTAEEYANFTEDTYIDIWGFSATRKMFTKEELISEYLEQYPDEAFDEDYFNEWLRDSGYCNEETFFEDEYLEVDSHRYTSESGDEIVIVCKYGFNN